MGNELILTNPAYDRIGDLMGFVKEMGRAIALSKMFGCDSEAQGQVMALECVSRRMPPMTVAERYHLIHGKLSLKAEAMLADFRAKMGGDYRIIERSDKRAAIELTLGGQQLTGEFSWEDAQREPFIYKFGKDQKEDDIVQLINSGQASKLKIKSSYATPRSRMQMLWARVVSDTVRAMAPEVTAGSYTPEEIEDFCDLPVAPSTGNGYATSGVRDELIAKLSAKAVSQAVQETSSALDPHATAATNNSPCSDAQIEAIKSLIREIAQLDPGITPKIQAKLKQAGLSKLVDLTQSEADGLKRSLQIKNLDAFFAASLAGHAKFRQPEESPKN